jgi:hypothetical protein
MQARQGDLDAACASYTEALGLDTPYGRHLLLANRSGARLQLGDSRGALQDADAAAECGPPSFHTAIIRQVLLLCLNTGGPSACHVITMCLCFAS